MRAPAGSEGRQTMRVRSGRAASVKTTSRHGSATGGSGVHGSESQRSASVSGRAARHDEAHIDDLEPLVGRRLAVALVVLGVERGAQRREVAAEQVGSRTGIAMVCSWPT